MKYIFFTFYLFFSSYLCLEVEIFIDDTSGNKIVLICKPINKHSSTDNNNRRREDRNSVVRNSQNLFLKSNGNVVIPRVRINTVNTTERYKCVPRVTRRNTGRLRRAIVSGRTPYKAGNFVPVKGGSCPTGYRIEDDKCLPCSPGTYTSGQDVKCFDCPKNFYQPQAAADSCRPCPDGKRTTSTGTASQDLCLYLTMDGKPKHHYDSMWIVAATFIIILIISLTTIAVLSIINYYNSRKKKKQMKPKPTLPTLEMLRDAERRLHSPSVPLLEGEEHEYEELDDIHSQKDLEEHIYEEIDFPSSVRTEETSINSAESEKEKTQTEKDGDARSDNKSSQKETFRNSNLSENERGDSMLFCDLLPGRGSWGFDLLQTASDVIISGKSALTCVTFPGNSVKSNKEGSLSSPGLLLGSYPGTPVSTVSYEEESDNLPAVTVEEDGDAGCSRSKGNPDSSDSGLVVAKTLALDDSSATALLFDDKYHSAIDRKLSSEELLEKWKSITQKLKDSVNFLRPLQPKKWGYNERQNVKHGFTDDNADLEQGQCSFDDTTDSNDHPVKKDRNECYILTESEHNSNTEDSLSDKTIPALCSSSTIRQGSKTPSLASVLDDLRSHLSSDDELIDPHCSVGHLQLVPREHSQRTEKHIKTVPPPSPPPPPPPPPPPLPSDVRRILYKR